MGNSQSEREKNEAEFGEKLHQIVREMYPEHADYITGMLLELDNNELKRSLTSTNREELLCKIHQAAEHLLPEGNLHLRNSSTDISGKSNILEKIKLLSSGASAYHNDSSFQTKEDLGEQVYALIEERYPSDAEKLTGILLEMDIQNLELMIKDSNLFEKKLDEVISLLENDSGQIKNSQRESAQGQRQDKTSLGEEVYSLVSEIDCDQAEKITGMLLEMDGSDLEVILRDREVLKEKVNQALMVLNNQRDIGETVLPLPGQEDKVIYGERLYYKICEWFPENADKISGMLLEMNVATLELLLNDSTALQEKAAYAASILNGTKINCETQYNLPTSEKSEAETRKSLGEKLYDIINDWYPGKADKLTDMLMDINHETLENLVLNKQMLKERVKGALAVLHRMEQTTTNREPNKHYHPGDATKEELGEKLFVMVEESHPENADRITGMLLEMRVEDIQRLLKNPLELQEKIQLTEDALE